MTITKRVVNIIRANSSSPKIKYPGAKVLKELHKHEKDLTIRLDAIEFNEYIFNLESTRWKQISSMSETKKANVIEKHQV